LVGPKAPAENPGDATTSKALVVDAYLIRMTEILANMSNVLGESFLAAEYNQQRETLRTEFPKGLDVRKKMVR
jgi:alpha-L-rhamnosidase